METKHRHALALGLGLDGLFGRNRDGSELESVGLINRQRVELVIALNL
jgi:hypothetical protein